MSRAIRAGVVLTVLVSTSGPAVGQIKVRPCPTGIIATYVVFPHCHDYWEQTGGPEGALAVSLAVNSSGHLFAGTQSGGLYRSTDNGMSWSLLGFTNYFEVSALTINAGGQIFAAATPEVWRSSDNGATWQLTSYPPQWVYTLAVTPGGLIFGGGSAGIYKSSDNGETWTAANNGLGTGYPPPTIGTIVVSSSTGDLFASEIGPFYASVFRSSDNGASWTKLNLPLMQLAGGLAVGSGGDVFLGTINAGIWRSTDNGATWTQTSATPSYVPALVATSSGALLAGTTEGIHRSTDNGASWSQVLVADDYPGVPGQHKRSFVISPGGNIFAGAGWHLYRSSNDGSTWTETRTGLRGTVVTALALNSRGHLYAGTEGLGAFVTKNQGDSWIEVNTGLTHSAVNALAINSSDHIFAGTNGGGVFRSTNNGLNWTERNSGLSNSDRDIQSLAISVVGDIFLSTMHTVYRSTNNAESWQEVGNGLTGWYVKALAIHPNETVFAVTYDGLFRSTNHGNNWTRLNSSSICPGENSVNVDELLATSAGQILAGTWECGLVRSVDNGAHWTRIFNTQQTEFLSLAVGSGGGIFAGVIKPDGNVDVLYSPDDGATWIERKSGLKDTAVVALAIDATGGPYAGTYGGAVHRKLRPPVRTTRIPFGGGFDPDSFFIRFIPCLPLRPSLPREPGQRLDCPPLPSCPECYRVTSAWRSDQGKWLEFVPRMLSALALTERQPPSNKESRAELGRLFRAVPVGPNLSRARRDSIVSILNRSAELRDEDIGKILSAINAFDIDSRTPKMKAKQVSRGTGQLVKFESLAWLAFPNVEKAGDLSLRLSDGLPSKLPAGLSPVWPVAVYSFQFTGRLDEKKPVEVSVYLPALRNGGFARNPRLLEWDGAAYRDITTSFEPESGVITGWTTKPSNYVVMSKN